MRKMRLNLDLPCRWAMGPGALGQHLLACFGLGFQVCGEWATLAPLTLSLPKSLCPVLSDPTSWELMVFSGVGTMTRSSNNKPVIK